ncbi:hypothetical protein P153DRAFT_328079 [Dothidotthia symphoricarpi CBS 119687]|uniref:Uncharacterized protein n=1 Tax=Dothidotthia symphoricarpi CBS 119687 TaxID=1392245 RepID=A0A6A5ZYP5_9PLEO|nr:uncharacterized protein P153DRAFT_328079 [Dothidotthia symphoricarpi CBS 119687]KAF2123508.1 hypothetical protein P153DRAFT_328079 [Dothidotthia symphoricarpi CBS 119687]
MKLSTTIFMLASTLSLVSAVPARPRVSVNKNDIFLRAASCLDLGCDFDTDCYGWRCGDCSSSFKCGCPPEAVSLVPLDKYFLC